MLTLKIQSIVARHMPEICAIEDLSFEYRWTGEDFRRCLRSRNNAGLVAECERTIAGYAVYEILRSRLRILNFAVHPDFRRQHVGDAMVRDLLDRLSPRRRNRIVLEVRESNLVAQQFWRAMGFRAVRIEHGFYDETDEDAYVFQYRLSSAERPDRERIRSSNLP